MVRPALHLVAPAPDRAVPAAAGPSAEKAFEQALVDLFGEAADVLGIPQSIAAIYAVIFASPRPLSFADIEERLHLSKGSVSQGLRVLRDFGAVHAVNARESKANGSGQKAVGGGQGGSSLTHPPSLSPSTGRREYFVPEVELRQFVARLLKERIEPQLAGNTRKLSQLAETIPFADPADAELMRWRLKHLQSWQRKARKLVPFAKTLLTLG